MAGPTATSNPGAIIALSPALSAATKAVFNSWGKGKVRSSLQPGRQEWPAGHPAGIRAGGIHRDHVHGDGEDLAYWNRYVGVTQMGGHGSFSEPRTGVNVTNGTDDLITSKLPALQAYQLTPECTAPPAGSFDAVAADTRQARLQRCRARVQPAIADVAFTDANYTAASRQRRGERTGTQRSPELRVAQRDQAVPDRAVGTGCGSTLRISTTAARRRWTLSCRPTTRGSPSA